MPQTIWYKGYCLGYIEGDFMRITAPIWLIRKVIDEVGDDWREQLQIKEEL